MVPQQSQVAATEVFVGQPIRIESHDTEWAARYESERTALDGAIGAWAVGGIHHIGSTAIPGVDAEPVIDILVGTEDRSASQACIEPLTALGYSHELYRSEELCALCKPDPDQRSYDLHLVPADTARYTEMLAFRDLLRADLQVAIGYAGMKRDLAERHAEDRAGYTAAKVSLIQAVLARI